MSNLNGNEGNPLHVNSNVGDLKAPGQEACSSHLIFLTSERKMNYFKRWRRALDGLGVLGVAPFETSFHVNVWNQLRSRRRVGGCSHACYVDLSVVEGGDLEGRGRGGRDARATARPCEPPLGRAPPPA